jgi:hypothetical protein
MNKPRNVCGSFLSGESTIAQLLLPSILEKSLILQLEKDMRPRAAFQKVGGTPHFFRDARNFLDYSGI